MATYSFVASHRIIDLTTVALLSNGAAGIPELFRTETAQNLGVTGTIVLATCNRLEIYVQLSVAEHLGPVSDMRKNLNSMQNLLRAVLKSMKTLRPPNISLQWHPG